uniref:Uncharacterized protein n=1 Tax=Alexandrium monilatum TaxID=311494 RepID=A0A7S4QQT0_9DINO
MLRGLQSHEAAMRTAPPKTNEQDHARAPKEGAAEYAARELLRVARKFMPSNVSMKNANEEEEEQQQSLPQDLRRVASQVLMRPNTILQEITGTGARKRPSSTPKLVLEEIPAVRRRSSSETRLRDGLLSSSGSRLSPKKPEGKPREDEPEVMPVWQSKESDRPCLVPPLCSGTAQIEADKGFFLWANNIVQEVAQDATTANFSVPRVPGPPPCQFFRSAEAIEPPCMPPPWQSFVPLSPAVR